MTLSMPNLNSDALMLMRDMLRLIAAQPNLNAVTPPLLQTARTITGADAAFYQVFDTPPTLIIDAIAPETLPAEEQLRTVVADLSEGLHLSTTLPDVLAHQYRGWLIAPVRSKHHLLGVLCLLFAEGVAVSDEALALLGSLMDGLKIVTTSVRTSERYQNQMRNQNEFVSITTHDLRSPLTVLKGIIGIIESSAVPDLQEKMPGFIEKMSANVAQMEFLVENIQDAGRYDPDTGFYEIRRAPADLTELVRKIGNNHLRPVEKQELSLTVECSDDVPIMNVDAHMLERAVTNLVDNAIKYTPNKGKIKVSVHRAGNNVIISVQDNGFGISPENARSLFQRHYRIRRTEHSRVKGSGLGLFIVRSVAQQHGGDARVESVEGEGSTFSITIPLAGANLLGASASQA